MAKQNSYEVVLSALSKEKNTLITTEELFNVALKEVVRIDNEDVVDFYWHELITAVKTKDNKQNNNTTNKVYVRGHGRNGSGNKDLDEILKAVFERGFQIDQANNNRPDSILKKLIPGEFEDYQISHLFEHRTNNPFLFEAWAFITNKKYINEYNGLILEYWNKLKDHFNSKAKHYNKYRIESLILAFAPLLLKFEQLGQSERKKAYVKMFKDNDISYWKMFTIENQFIDKYGKSV